MKIRVSVSTPFMKYRFFECVLDIDAHSLTRDGEVQNVEPMVFDLLLLFVQNAGSLVTRDQIVEEVWGGRIVSESAISARIAAMRRAVGDDGKTQSIIRTVPRRGFQFIAELSQEPEIGSPNIARESHQTIKYTKTDDGVNLAYAISGKGPPIFRIAHFPTHLELEWQEATERRLFDHLSVENMLVRFDQRGCGLSDIYVDDLSMPRVAEDIKAVADAAGLEQFALYSMSGGSLASVEFAAKYPNRLTHLVLQSGYVDGRAVRDGSNHGNGHETIEAMIREGWDVTDSAFVKAVLALYMPTASTGLIEELAEVYQASSPKEIVVRNRDIINHHSVVRLLSKVDVPTLVIHSRSDAVHPLSEAKKMASGIPDAEFLVLESANHYPLPDEPSWQIQVDAIREFINRDARM